jgi:hypothetical protein
MIVLITIDRNRNNNRLCHKDKWWWQGHASRTRTRQTREIALIKLSTLIQHIPVSVYQQKSFTSIQYNGEID